MDNGEQISALLGGKKPQMTQEEDWKSKYEEAQRQLNSAKVEEGRVRKLNEEKKALEKRLAELERGSQAREIAAAVSDEDRGDIPEEYVGLAAKVAAEATARVSKSMSGEIERIRKEREDEQQAMQKRVSEQFLTQVDARYPKFLKDIGVGGDKEEAWKSFMENNSESVSKAYNSCNLKGMIYHLDRFYREIGVRPPEGGRVGASAPDPVMTTGSGLGLNSDDPNKKWTKEEYDALEKKAYALRASGDFKGYTKMVQEMDNILAEGRLA